MKYKDAIEVQHSSIVNSNDINERRYSMVDGPVFPFGAMFPFGEPIPFHHPDQKRLEKRKEEIKVDWDKMRKEDEKLADELDELKIKIRDCIISGESYDQLEKRRDEILYYFNKIQPEKIDSLQDAYDIISEMLRDDSYADGQREDMRKKISAKVEKLSSTILDDCLKLQDKIFEVAEIAHDLAKYDINSLSFYREWPRIMIPDIMKVVTQFTKALEEASSRQGYLEIRSSGGISKLLSTGR